MSEPLFLGVDAGNSKTLAIIVDGGGGLRGFVRGGVGDIYGQAGADAAVGVVLDTVGRALADAGTPMSALASAAFRLAGADWPEDSALWAEALDGFLDSGTARSILNDGFACLRCGDPSGRGVAVSLGTGVAIAARGPGEREFAASWWLQDYLGAAGLGHDGVRAAALAELGMAPPTVLGSTLPEFYGQSDVEGLLHVANSRETSLGHTDVARAARLVLAAASAGDGPAVEIVSRHATRIVDYVGACARRVGLDPAAPFSVVLGGSVASEPTGELSGRVIAAFEQRMPQASVVTERVVPILGCALDALAEGGVVVDAELQRRVLSTALPPELLVT